MREVATSADRKADPSTTLSTAKDTSARGIKVVFSPRIAKASNGHDINGDVVVFDHAKKHLMVIEVKGGDTFDTKKASGELNSLQQSAAELSKATATRGLSHSVPRIKRTNRPLVAGAKGRFSQEEVMTDRELCSILAIKFDAFRAGRGGEHAANLADFLGELVDIPEIAQRLRQKLQ